jgi:hypothetical protein
MGGFVEAVLSFPTVLFTPLLIIVVAYWSVVVTGGADPDAGAGDLLASVGLGGLPAAVPISLLVTFAWFGSLAGAVFLPGWVALLAALILAWLVTRLATILIGRLRPAGTDPSRADFVGLTCVIRTGRVTRTFGQAEVHAADGSSAIVQVRQTGGDELRAGTLAVLYDFDPEGEFFWVVPADVALS